MYNINSHINVNFFFKKLPGEAGNVPLVYIDWHIYTVYIRNPTCFFSKNKANNQKYNFFTIIHSIMNLHWLI